MDSELAAFLTERFDEIGRQLAIVEQRFDGVEQRFDAVDQRFDTVDQRFDAVDQRFDAVEQRFDTVDQRFTAVDQRVDAVNGRFDHARTEFGVLVERLRDELHLVAEGHMTLDRKIDTLRDENEASHREILTLLRASYQHLDGRVSRLESRIRDEGSPTF